ncbi:MAG TPA: hypothetical protein VMJ92_01080 [Candidatus Limnocylindrales bacterium]|nr:hypothetical protein [Candidatus Limnocylindrales bacterium]
MIATLPLRRVGPARRSAARARPAATRRRGRSTVRERKANLTWEVRSFASASAAIALGFVLALLYLSQTTAISAGGYELQRLQAERDEVARQSALLEVRLAQLDSPARIEADATRIGLVRVSHVLVVPAEKLAIRR